MSQWTKGIVLLTFLLTCNLLCFSQNKEELEKKRDALLEQIKYTNSLIEASKSNQKLTEGQVKLLAEQINLREELISNIQSEVASLTGELTKNQSAIEELESELEVLKKEYAKMVRFAYENRNAYDKLMFVFASGDFNQAYKRLKYLQQYSAYRKRQAELIDKNRQTLEKKQAELALRKKEKERLLLHLTREKNKLGLDKSQQSSALQKLRNEERSLRKTLKKQEKDKEKLNKEIQRIILAEIEAEKKKNKGVFALSPEAKKLSENFEANKGKLPWPVDKGVITGKFGKQAHPILKGITIDNNGIDISTSAGSNTVSIFKGEVVSVFTISGAGQSVMINHGAYRVVYTNLLEVFVKKGDVVQTQQPIGKLLTDADNKTEAHIEIWKISNAGVHKQNPQYWLLKQ